MPVSTATPGAAVAPTDHEVLLPSVGERTPPAAAAAAAAWTEVEGETGEVAGRTLEGVAVKDEADADGRFGVEVAAAAAALLVEARVLNGVCDVLFLSASVWFLTVAGD